jgi:hypothetical protein
MPSNDRTINEQLLESYVKGNGYGLIWSTIPAFALSEWDKSWKTPVSIFCLWAEITSQVILNSKQKCYLYDRDDT